MCNASDPANIARGTRLLQRRRPGHFLAWQSEAAAARSSRLRDLGNRPPPRRKMAAITRDDVTAMLGMRVRVPALLSGPRESSDLPGRGSTGWLACFAAPAVRFEGSPPPAPLGR